MHEAKTNLSRLVRAVEEGEEVLIARANRPVVRLTLVAPAGAGRVFGSAKGLIHMSEDFDAPLDDFVDSA